MIMLATIESEIDLVVGLELGADGYTTKPHTSPELLARNEAVLRRKGSDSAFIGRELKHLGIRLESNR